MRDDRNPGPLVSALRELGSFAAEVIGGALRRALTLLLFWAGATCAIGVGFWVTAAFPFLEALAFAAILSVVAVIIGVVLIGLRDWG